MVNNIILNFCYLEISSAICGTFKITKIYCYSITSGEDQHQHKMYDSFTSRFINILIKDIFRYFFIYIIN